MVKKRRKKNSKKKKRERAELWILSSRLTTDKLKESEKRDKYHDLAEELKKTPRKHESDADTNCNWGARYSHQIIDEGTGGSGNKRSSGNHPNYIIIMIGQNTEKKSSSLVDTYCLSNFGEKSSTNTVVKNSQRS